MDDFLLWKKAKPFFYMSSVAATWIWAPAIFVSSDKAYNTGIPGFLMFLIPNVLTLVLFAFFAERVRNYREGFTLGDVVEEAGIRQRYLHITVSLTVLICSSCVQLIGLYTLFQAWYPISKQLSAFLISICALLMVWKDGIKGSIRTDAGKYVIMLVFGIILFLMSKNNPIWQGSSPIPTLDLFKAFGATTIIGLLAAPYADQTFWQRVFSISKERIRSVFFGSAFLFLLIPLIFGLIGFYAPRYNNWVITTTFSGAGIIMLSICVICALLSTLDSNLCAISSIVCSDFKQPIQYGRYSMIVLLCFSSLLMICTNLTITNLFLIYGTIRTCIALPTVLIILNRYDKNRLFIGTCLSVLIAPLGYILSGGYWLFTVLALLIPIMGYSNNKETV